MQDVDKKAKKAAYDKAYYEKNKERRKHWGLAGTVKKRYGLTVEEYNTYRASFPDVCGICGKLEEQKRRLSLDHCHKTKKIRGLLCHKCNVAIGLLEDDVVLLDKAKEYLCRM